MRGIKSLLVAAAASVACLAAAPRAQAQVSFGINIGGPAPVCSYGYYDYAPYNCAPYGYYGPEWFNGGVFLGAGPWFHGPRGFYGHVNRAYDPRYGYHGAFPPRGGAYREPPDHFRNFRPSGARDGQGHERPGGGGRPGNRPGGDRPGGGSPNGGRPGGGAPNGGRPGGDRPGGGTPNGGGRPGGGAPNGGGRPSGGGRPGGDHPK